MSRKPGEKRPIEDLFNLPRAMGRSTGRLAHEEYEAAVVDKPKKHRIGDYLKIRIKKWLGTYLKNRFGKKHKLEEYVSPDTGVYRLSTEDPGGKVTISLTGDWGSATEESAQVVDRMKVRSPEYTIHLGDVYYVGERDEVEDAFFGSVNWHLGSQGSFALNGNHEMYAKGNAYFNYLLGEKLGTLSGSGVLKPQHTSFFALQNEHWLVIGLDTGYHSVGIPIVEKLFKASHKLDEKELRWLREALSLQDDDQRGVILLSHHQYISAFESNYKKAGRQLSEFLNRPVLWFWGHEHRLALYGKAGHGSGIEAYGRCVGHGGMPVEVNEKPKPKKVNPLGLGIYDARVMRTIEAKTIFGKKKDFPIGFNGCAHLTFDGPRLTIEYEDLVGNQLVTEKWSVGPQGHLKGEEIQVHCTDAGFETPDSNRVIADTSN